MKLIIVLISVFALGRGQEPTCSETDEYLPHHECQKYYICDNRVPVEQECPETLYWNQEELYCDFKVNVPECQGGTRPPPGSSPATTPNPGSSPVTTPTQTATTQTITTPRTTIVTGSSQAPTTAVPGQCPPNGIVRIPNPDFCERYYQCVEGLRIDATCTSGFYFDIQYSDCNFAEVVDCGNRATPGPPTTTVPTTVPTGTTTVPTGTTTVPTVTTTVPTVTTRVPTVTTTVPSVTTTVPAITTIVPITTTRPPGPPSCPATGVVYVPYPDDCSLYLICVEGSGSIYRCPIGELFDRVDLYCRNAVDARCA